MSTVFIRLKRYDDCTAEISYSGGRASNFTSIHLPINVIEEISNEVGRYYYIGSPRLKSIGQTLYTWIDSRERWLSQAIRMCYDEELILAIEAVDGFSNLPWEILHDGNEFLIEHISPAVVPTRWIRREAHIVATETRSLRLLFMASSPVGDNTSLDFEAEEAAILEATKDSGVRLQVEESGCIAILGKIWGGAKDRFDVFHLSGHAGIETQTPYSPYFITESETGEPQKTYADDLRRVFQFRFPSLIFLSGCRTAQTMQGGAVLSLAEDLMSKGALAVLGWGLPVNDHTATSAAAVFYERLCQGYSITQSLSKTHEYLKNELNLVDWHLLRLYLKGMQDLPGALVSPPGPFYFDTEEYGFERFLDPVTQKVRVATPESFVGRRRTLQRCLRNLRSREKSGVLLWGIGGVGKSTVAARLLDRLAGFDRIVIHKALDESKLLSLLESQCTNVAGFNMLRDGEFPLQNRLKLFLREGLNNQDQKLVVILDDFESNLDEPGSDGVVRIDRSIIAVFSALLDALIDSGGKHKLIITSRYLFEFPSERYAGLIHVEDQLTRLSNQEARKKYLRLSSFARNSRIPHELQEHAKIAADGNPRLLEWLNVILADQSLDSKEVVHRMTLKANEYRESILAEELLKQLPRDHVQMLNIIQIIMIPVPVALIECMCPNVADLTKSLRRLATIGLLESYKDQCGERFRVPRTICDLLSPPRNYEDLCRVAASRIYELWWNSECSDEIASEILRLSLKGNLPAICLDVANQVMSGLNRRRSYRESIRLGREVIRQFPDWRIYHHLGCAYHESHDIENADICLRKALRGPIRSDPKSLGQKSDLLRDWAQFLANRHSNKALTKFSPVLQHLRNSLGIAEDIGDKKRIACAASALGWQIFCHLNDKQWREPLGETEELKAEALVHLNDALLLYRSIDDKQGEADTLHNLGCHDPDPEKRLRLTNDALAVSRLIGDVGKQARHLHQLGKIYYYDMGAVLSARESYAEALKIKEENGGYISSSAYQWAKLEQSQGNVLKAFLLILKAVEFNQRLHHRDEEKSWKRLIRIFYAWVNKGFPNEEANCESQAQDIMKRIYQLSHHSRYKDGVYGIAKGLALWGLGEVYLRFHGNTQEGCSKLQSAYLLLCSIDSNDSERVKISINCFCGSPESTA